ncbi:MAG: peptidase S53, partial [Gluconacetobacter diazotrophicus]|nr:peptidase S53 [Gluconacetobacter diazotrophicus]
MTLPRHLRAHATTRSGRFGLLLGCTMLTAAGFASSARAAEGWVGTATRAYLPAVLSPRAGEGAARTQFRTALNRASASAVAANAATPVTVSVALALRNEADLDRATAEIAAPGNANYGRFLSAAEFLAAYAPTQAQVDAVVTHLRASGFTDIAVAPNRLLVSATGRPAAVRAAFNTGLTQFSFEGRTVFANASAAQVPASLGGTVSAVLGLQTVSRPHTFHRVVPAAAAAPSRAAPDAAASTVAHNPTDFPKIYDVGSVATGAKTKVGIITWGSLTKVQSDLSTFAK